MTARAPWGLPLTQHASSVAHILKRELYGRLADEESRADLRTVQWFLEGLSADISFEDRVSLLDALGRPL